MTLSSRLAWFVVTMISGGSGLPIAECGFGHNLSMEMWNGGWIQAWRPDLCVL